MTTEREDALLGEAFAALGPSAEQIAAMQGRVLQALEDRAALQPGAGSLARAVAGEWLELLRTRPAANGLLVAAAAVTLLLTSPLALLPLALLSG